MTAALLVIDIQNDYFPGGAMEVVGAREAGVRAGKLVDQARAAGWPVIHIQHVSTRPGATFFIPGTAGAEIHPCVQPLDGETVIQKNHPNGFRQTGLLETLRSRNIEHLTLCGMMTHMCIDATTRAAADLGFSCRLVHDACATRDLAFGGRTIPAADVHAAFVAALNGIYATVASTEDVCATMEITA